MSIEIISVFSLLLLLKRFVTIFYFFAERYDFILTRALKTSVDDLPLEEPKVIDHVSQDQHLYVIFLRRLVLFDRKWSPLDDSIDYLWYTHFVVIFRFIVDDGLLQATGHCSSFAKLFDRVKTTYLYLYLFRGEVFIAEHCDCFLDLVDLHFIDGFLFVFWFFLRDLKEQLACLLDIQRKQSVVEGWLCSELITILQHFQLFCDWTEVVAVNQRTHFVYFAVNQ